MIAKVTTRACAPHPEPRLAALGKARSNGWWGLLRGELSGNVSDRFVQAGQLAIIGLGHVDRECLMQSDRKVERIHRIEVELIAECHGAIENRRIDIRSNVEKELQHALLHVVRSHKVSGACKASCMCRRKRAPARPSVTR